MSSGQTVAGKVSWFGGPNDRETGVNKTASGAPTSVPGIAVYNRATLGGYWKVTAANGKSAILKQTDLGPAPFTGRKIDVTYSALGKLGYKESDFPTDSTFRATYLGHDPGAAATAAKAVSPLPAVASSSSVLKPATTSQQLNMPALEAAEHKTALDRILLPEVGAGAENPLKLVMPTASPSPADYEKTVTIPGSMSTSASTSPQPASGSTTAPEKQVKAVSAAVTQLGTPYRWGGEEEHKGFDCSGLAQWAYRAAGISIPRTAQEQFNASTKTNKATPGSLIFFGSSPQNITHVEIVAGDGRMIGADHTGTNVRYESLPAVGSKWGEDTVIGIGVPTGKAGTAPSDAVVAQGSGTVVGAYHSPNGSVAIVHHATGPKAGKVEHVKGSLPVGHQYYGGDVLGAPIGQGGL
jgi:cell wall-associated NlpC family hydrolase